MKKLWFVLIVVALAALLLVGCVPVTPGEGEGEGESEAVVAIDGAVVIDGKTYVSEGPHDVVVTFPAPVVGWADGWIDNCEGDYSTRSKDGGFVLFPSADKKVWTGSVMFYGEASDCCATYIGIDTGTCEDEICIWFPVIVDGEYPYAEIAITVANCTCAGCAISFSSTSTDPECAEGELCCGDDCSGLASWSITLYDAYPFDECCDPTVCEEPVYTCSGTACPIECVTDCLAAGTYYAVVKLVDNVGFETTYTAEIIVTGGTAGTDDCAIEVREGNPCGEPFGPDTTDTIGSCDLII